jgi:colicin import membrane protein
MNGRSPNAFLLSATLHGVIVALVVLLTYFAQDREPETPKIFELVAGAGDNFGATDAPALGVPGGIKLDIPQPPAPTPSLEPASPVEPAPEPTPETPIAPAPTPTPAKPTAPAKPKDYKPVNMAKLVDRIADKRAANIEKKFKQEQKAAEERAAKEAALNAKRMTKAEFDRQNKGATPSQKSGAIKTTKIDAEGIAGGVTGGSTANKTGGAGGKALTREEIALSDAYIAMLIQRLREAHQKPDGLSDLLQAKVEFRLNPNGTISGVNIVKSSGNAEFDASVLAAFRKVHLPTPPANLKTDIYYVTFKMKEDE